MRMTPEFGGLGIGNTLLNAYPLPPLQKVVP